MGVVDVIGFKGAFKGGKANGLYPSSPRGCDGVTGGGSFGLPSRPLCLAGAIMSVESSSLLFPWKGGADAALTCGRCVIVASGPG